MVALVVQIIIVLANVFTVSKSSIENSCQCHLHNATLTMINNKLQFVEQTFNSNLGTDHVLILLADRVSQQGFSTVFLVFLITIKNNN